MAIVYRPQGVKHTSKIWILLKLSTSQRGLCILTYTFLALVRFIGENMFQHCNGACISMYYSQKKTIRFRLCCWQCFGMIVIQDRVQVIFKTWIPIRHIFFAENLKGSIPSYIQIIYFDTGRSLHCNLIPIMFYLFHTKTNNMILLKFVWCTIASVCTWTVSCNQVRCLSTVETSLGKTVTENRTVLAKNYFRCFLIKTSAFYQRRLSKIMKWISTYHIWFDMVNSRSKGQ